VISVIILSGRRFLGFYINCFSFNTERNQAVSRWPLTSEARVRARFNPCGICVGQNGTGTGFAPSSSVFPVTIIPPLLHAHLSPPHEVCDSSDQAAYNRILGPKLGASSLTRYLAGTGNEVLLFITYRNLTTSVNLAIVVSVYISLAHICLH
jgi:hypothetical protein